jgi:hypothetical protein
VVLILFMYALDPKDKNITQIITNNGFSQRKIIKYIFIILRIIMFVKVELFVNQTK